MNIKQSDLNKMIKSGIKVSGSVSKNPRVSKDVMAICQAIKEAGLGYELEYRFHTSRKWRFDVYIPELNLGIEYEGLFSEKSRHTTVVGYTEDCIKYNSAAIMGIHVLRYTNKNLKNLRTDLACLIYKKREQI